MKLGAFLLLVLLAVTGLGYMWWNAGVPVEVAAVTTGEIRAFIEERGETRLPKTHLISMPYNSRIEPIELAEGSMVKAGQVVARITPLDLSLEVEQAQAAVERLDASIRENDDATVENTGLEQALKYVESMDRTVEAAEKRVEAGKAKMDYAETNLGRAKRLAQTNTRTEEELHQAEVAFVESRVEYQQDLLIVSALKSMQAATALVPTSVRQYIARKKLSHDVLQMEKVEAEARLRLVKNNQKRGVLASPIDGVVLERLESNERQLSAGTVLLRIGQIDLLEVEADLLSEDVVNATIGDAAEILGPAIGPTPADGVLTEIHPAGFTKMSSLGVEQQRVKVIVAFADGELARLRAERNLGLGYRVRVRIYTDQRTGALLIPRSAIFRGPAGEWQVFAVREGRARLQTIQIGLMNDLQVESREGLAEGESVVLVPDTNLADGERVSPINSAK